MHGTFSQVGSFIGYSIIFDTMSVLVVRNQGGQTSMSISSVKKRSVALFLQLLRAVLG